MTKLAAPVFKEARPTRITLMGPGPSDISDRVLQAMARPQIGHLDHEFIQLMDECQEMLRYIFQTKNQLTLPVSATGSAGMETCFTNLIEPGNKVLVGVNGVFGGRMADLANRLGAEVISLEKPWGEVFTKEEIAQALDEHNPDILALVHAETSTGAAQPMEGIGPLVREKGALLVMDCVTSLAGTPVFIDEWQVDAAFSGTQKCISCPPGLSPLTFNERAVDKMSKRKKSCTSWYFDLSMVQNYWGASAKRSYHHTAPISMNYAFHESLRIICEEGLEARWERHKRLHNVLRAGLEALGLRYTAAEGHQLPQLNAVSIPDGVDDLQVRKTLRDTFHIEIGGGLGQFAGKVWRIGLMGAACQEKNIFTLLGALEACLVQQGYKVPGSAIAAASEKL